MSMLFIPDAVFFRSSPLAHTLKDLLERKQNELELGNTHVFLDFPVFNNTDGDIVRSKILIISQKKGIFLVGLSEARGNCDELNDDLDQLETLYSHIYSKLVKEKELKLDRKQLRFDVEAILYCPGLREDCEGLQSETIIANSDYTFLQALKDANGGMSGNIYDRVVGAIDGANGLVRMKPRRGVASGSKGDIANKLEAEITKFDHQQRHGYLVANKGVQRIRGLAGSGKTVILAMKAALTHLEKPDAKILFTFHTKSLYQHVQRLITRFYRQFSDGAPDFENSIKVMHSWGGRSVPGVYYEACIENDVQPLTYSQACTFGGDPFDAACKEFLNACKTPKQTYDYSFVDEGQDFPNSFVRLVAKLTKENRTTWAYDELQNIFQTNLPSIQDVVGDDIESSSDDIVLYKCYRNPREILVCAHALGFGIYSGGRIVQMLESRERWESMGYNVLKGEFNIGDKMIIARPVENSLRSVSDAQSIDEIISASAFQTFDEEVNHVAQCVKQDIDAGLRPDDILVLSLDNRHAKNYLTSISEALSQMSIESHNNHQDSYGVRDFEQEGMVTLSTINKAKGNEAYSVYAVGVDAVYSRTANKGMRNMIFTALTRAKGWVHVTGLGDSAQQFHVELQRAKKESPNMAFTYSEPESVIKDDMDAEKFISNEEEKEFDRLVSQIGIENVRKLLANRDRNKGGNQ